MSVATLAEQVRAREASPREVVQSYLERIEAHRELNAYITVRAEEALAEAESAPPGPLHGVPVAVKDVIDVAGCRTTAASEILRHSVAARDATAVARLRAAGAVVIGKLNTHEFALGAFTTSPHFGPAHNPWSPDRICGGSSGGSGCAAAADLAAGTLGTDTAGSIRIPACLCGVTGLRPSLGLVPTDGVVPVSWTFDTVGPIARGAADVSLLLEALAPSYTPELDRGVHGLRVGVVEHLFERSDPAVAACAAAAVEELRSLGASVESVDIPLLEEAGTILAAIMLPEAAELHLPWLRERLADYGPDVRVRLLAGLALPSTAYVTGLRARRWYLDGLAAVFERFDLLAHPAMPVVAPPIGADAVELGGERAVRLRRWAPGRARARRSSLGRRDRPPRRCRLPARHRLARAAAMTRRGYALVAAGVAAVGALAAGLVLAFGGGHGHAANDPTPAAYLTSVAAICNRYGHRLDEIPPAIDPAIQGDALASINEALPLLRRQTRAIRALPRPAALRPKLERFFALNDRSIRALERGKAAIHVNDVPRLSRALTDFGHARDSAKQLAREIGFRC